jgi:hypothetical protein
VVLLAVLILALLVTLILAQRYLSRATHRTFNLPLVAATLATLVLALAAGGILTVQRAHLGTAAADGSVPVANLADLRILALNERGDEALTLVARGGSDDNEKDFRTTAAAAGIRLTRIAREVDGGVAADLRARHDAYVAAHAEVRRLDDSGDYGGAVALAIGPQTTRNFTAYTDAIGTSVEAHKATFTTEVRRAGQGLGPLTVLGPLLALIVCGLVVAGIRARLEEYR